MNPWILTYTGKRVNFPVPDPSSICIEDIAHHLSQIIRYTGASLVPYTVAQHSVYVSEIVSPEFALTGLLHDAPEAYLGDVNKPLKSLLPDYKRIENAFWTVISEKYGLPQKMPKEVHEADVQAFLAEWETIMPKPQFGPVPYLPTPPEQKEIGEILTGKESEVLFLERFYELSTRRTSENIDQQESRYEYGNQEVAV